MSALKELVPQGNVGTRCTCATDYDCVREGHDRRVSEYPEMLHLIRGILAAMPAAVDAIGAPAVDRQLQRTLRRSS